MQNMIEKNFEQGFENKEKKGLNRILDLKTAWDGISWLTKSYLYQLQSRLRERDITALDELRMIPEEIVPSCIKIEMVGMLGREQKENIAQKKIDEYVDGPVFFRDVMDPEILKIN